MPALSGLADIFSTLLGSVLGGYFAGIWRHDLARGLPFKVKLLQITNEEPHIRNHPSNVTDLQKRPPSWSWTSIVLDCLKKFSYGSVILNGFVQDSRHFKLYPFKVSQSLKVACLAGILMAI
jgi:hypothetical protein